MAVAKDGTPSAIKTNRRRTDQRTHRRSIYKAVSQYSFRDHPTNASCRLQEFPNPLQQLGLDVVGNGSPASWGDFVDELVHRNLLQPLATDDFLAVLLVNCCWFPIRTIWLGAEDTRRSRYKTPNALVRKYGTRWDTCMHSMLELSGLGGFKVQRIKECLLPLPQLMFAFTDCPQRGTFDGIHGSSRLSFATALSRSCGA